MRMRKKSRVDYEEVTSDTSNYSTSDESEDRHSVCSSSDESSDSSDEGSEEEIKGVDRSTKTALLNISELALKITNAASRLPPFRELSKDLKVLNQQLYELSTRVNRGQ